MTLKIVPIPINVRFKILPTQHSVPFVSCLFSYLRPLQIKVYWIICHQFSMYFATTYVLPPLTQLIVTETARFKYLTHLCSGKHSSIVDKYPEICSWLILIYCQHANRNDSMFIIHYLLLKHGDNQCL